MLRPLERQTTEEEQLFFYLLGYRWISLLPPFLALLLTSGQEVYLQVVFLAAIVDNLFLTLLHPRVNRLVIRLPWILAIDLLTVAMFLAFTGGVASLFYLYALSPLLAAALFLRMRGALVAASFLSAGYAAALILAGVALDPLHVLSQVISFFVIAIVFGYAANLIERIRQERTRLAQSNATLERTNRELASIHHLALQMQSSSVDMADIQEVVLTTITNAMGFERAMMALVDPDRNALLGWLTHHRNEAPTPAGISHTMEIALHANAGVVAQTVLRREPAYVTDGLPPTANPAMNRQLKLVKYAILPLYMRDHPIGVLLVDNPESGTPITAESMHSLRLVADQAAIALGSTRLCIERAQRLAVEEERNRIAMEIHDTATQSLFGIVYTLDGCIKRMDQDPASVRPKLVDLRTVAARTMNDLRQSVYEIWAGTLTEEDLRSELVAYLQTLGAPPSLDVSIEIHGSFAAQSLPVRRSLSRIATEGLANVVKHSGATHASISLDLDRVPARLVIEDNGRGFEMHERFPAAGIGFASIRERAHAIGADARIESKPGQGTRVIVELACEMPALMEPSSDANPAC